MYGIIDIGSNTMRLVVYRLQDGVLFPILTQKVTAGLASYISPKKKMKNSGVQEAIRVLKEFQQSASMIHLENLWVFSTAPFRNIINTEEVLEAIYEACGIQVQVLSGKEEALLDYYGILHSIPMEEGLLADVGGGSTELVLYQGKKVMYAVSIPWGSLNSYTNFVENIFPTATELKKIRTTFEKQLKTLSFPTEMIPAPVLCSVGGTARTALKLYNTLYKIKTYNLEYDSHFFEDCLLLLKKDPHSLKDLILKLTPDRIHTLLPGMVLFHAIVDFFHCQTVVTSLCGVREGFLYRILNNPPEKIQSLTENPQKKSDITESIM